MIHTNRTVTVGNQESIIDSPIILYRGDREVEVEFTLNGNKFTFTNGGNVIKSANATHGQLVINTPSGENMFSEVSECHEGKVVFVITKEMIDELIEVGFYSFQIRLFDESQVSRVTIPPVYQGIDIRNPIAAEDETNVVDIGLVDYAIVVKDEFEDLSTFLPSGDYNKTDWESKDVISAAKLNKIEDALYLINDTMEASDLVLFNRLDSFNNTLTTNINNFNKDLTNQINTFNRNLTNEMNALEASVNATHTELRADYDALNTSKANVSDVNRKVWSMSNMGQDVREAMTGGSVAVVGENSIKTDNIAHFQITPEKTTFIDRPNLLVLDNVTDNCFVMCQTGEIVNNNGYMLTDFIPVEHKEEYIFSHDGPSEFMAFYNEEKTYIGGRRGSNLNQEISLKINDASIKYIRYNISKTLRDVNLYGLYKKTSTLSENIRLHPNNFNDNSLSGRVIEDGSIYTNKLDINSGYILSTLAANLVGSLDGIEYEYGFINADGSYSTGGDTTQLNNIRSVKRHFVRHARINLISDDIMIKIVYYDSELKFQESSPWMAKAANQWAAGGTNYIDIDNAYVGIALAITKLNTTGEMLYTIDEMVSRIEVTDEQLVLGGSFIHNDNIMWDTINLDLDQSGCVLDGPMELPSEFGDIPFDIIKHNNRYDISVSDAQLNLNPTVIYVSSAGANSGLGLDKTNPITLYAVKQNFIANAYPTKNIKIVFTENLYFIDGPSGFDLIGTGQDSTVGNVTFESDCGFTWIGYGNRNISWTPHDTNTNIYKYACETKVSDLVEVEHLKSNGMPNLYVKKASLGEVTKEGEFCQVNGVVYVYPHSTNDINKLNIIFGFDYNASTDIPGIITIRKSVKSNVIFKNIGTFLDCLNLRDLRSLDVWYYFFNCRFHRDSMDSFALKGKYKAVLVDCVADYGSKDNFNYHSTSKDSVAIELNCMSYGAGQYKLDTVGVNTTKDSCNGSTAHEGMCIARFGCSYWDCEGSVVADVNNCVTYCVDCSVKNILPTISNSNYQAAYMMHDNRNAGSNPYRPVDDHMNYLINCTGGGSNVTWGIRSEKMKIVVANFKGNSSHYQERSGDIIKQQIVK